MGYNYISNRRVWVSTKKKIGEYGLNSIHITVYKKFEGDAE